MVVKRDAIRKVKIHSPKINKIKAAAGSAFLESFQFSRRNLSEGDSLEDVIGAIEEEDAKL